VKRNIPHCFGVKYLLDSLEYDVVIEAVLPVVVAAAVATGQMISRRL